MLEEKVTIEYVRRAKTGDNEAKEALIENNVSLVKCIVKRYLGKGVDYDDLFQIACMGFLKAITGFDESFGVKFSTYAVPMIAGEIKRFMRDDGSVKVSRAMKQTAKEMHNFIEYMRGKLAYVFNVVIVGIRKWNCYYLIIQFSAVYHSHTSNRICVDKCHRVNRN